MITLYRVCPFESPNILARFRGRKEEMIDLCLNSFLKAGAEKIIFLVDSMSLEKFKKYGEVIDCTGLGNVGTFHKQIEIGKRLDKVFLCEDDYLWRPNTFPLLKRAVEEFDFVSPYDHPSHYLEDRFDKHYEMKMIDNIVYREAPSNTLTFATKKLPEVWVKMVSFGIADHPMFQSLREDGYRIWNPTYSFATHLAEGLLAPNVEWVFD